MHNASLSGAVLTAAPQPKMVLLSVGNMHCSRCVAKIENALARFGEDVSMRADPASRSLSLSWDQSQHPLEALLNAIQNTGFDAQLVQLDDGNAVPSNSLQRIAVAVLFAMQTMMLALADYLGAGASEPLVHSVIRYGQWITATPVVLYAGWPFLYGAWRDIRQRQASMDLPVSIAIVTAYCFSAIRVVSDSGVLWFDSAVMFVALLSIGRHIETSGRQRATQHLQQLFRQQKDSAQRVNDDGSVTECNANQLVAGDIVEVLPTEAIPVDGNALTAALVSEAVLTGEATAIEKQENDSVFAGSIHLGSQALRVRTTVAGQQTSLARIIRLMHQALTSRPQLQQLADRIAGYFVITVLGLAAAGGIAWSLFDASTGLSVALTVLVSSCPCALSLATPAALAAAISRMARRGLMVLKLDGFLAGQDITRVVFDKTGTLTEDRLRLSTVFCSDISEKQVLAIAAGLEQISHHPIAQAFEDIEALPMEKLEAFPRSVKGYYQGSCYALAASKVSEEQDFAIEKNAGDLSLTLTRDDQAIAVITLHNAIREEAIATVQQLKARGIGISLYSGDTPNNVATVAAHLGIEQYQGGLKPSEKLDHLRRLQRQGQRVAAIGDGVNDAPLLAAADLGIALGTGSTQAKSGADIILPNNGLHSVCDVLRESKVTNQRIRQNLLWAAAYNLTIFPLALSGSLAPWVAAIGMASSSILVVSNALRGPSNQSHQSAREPT